MDTISGYSYSRETSSLPYLLQGELVNKNFLLVLDDLDLEGEGLGFWHSTCNQLRVGSRGSRVLLTSRDDEHVAKIMATVPIKYRLGSLSGESSWSLFKKSAFHGRDPEAFPSLVATGREIARRCRGSPLALKMMGALLHSEEASEGQWENILHNRVWDSRNAAEMTVPEFCFRRLPPHLRRCFLYCSLFPRGYLFKRDQLVRLWMAQDFVSPEEGKQMEDTGNDFIDELLWRSFLDCSRIGEQTLVMQRHILDLSQSTLADEFVGEDDGQLCSISIDARHSSLLAHTTCGQEIQLPSSSEAMDLRTFLLVKRWRHVKDEFYLREEDLFRLQIPDDAFLLLGRLRALDLSCSCVIELPDSIGMLKHLRYLSLNYTSIRKLPESTANLHSLQTLELRSCWRLYMLPGGIKKLTSLRHLDLLNLAGTCASLADVGELTNLQTLPSFVVWRRRGSEASTIRQLKHLGNLRGELCISGLRDVIFAEDAEEAMLSNKEHLEKLTLEWFGVGSPPEPIYLNDEQKKVEEMGFEAGREMPEDERWIYDISSASEGRGKKDNVGRRQRRLRQANRWFREEVFESLRPHPNLRRLVVEGYGGVRLPSWMGDPSFFSRLVSLALRACSRCRTLPPGLGQLPSLKHLSIKGFGTEKRLRDGSPEPVAMKGFTSLEHLAVEQMPRWEEWRGSEDDGFPKLQSLSITCCPQLKRLPQCLPSLTKLEIIGCEQLTGFPTAPSLVSLEMMFPGNSDEKEKPWFSWLGQLTTLQSLTISGIWDLASAPLQKLSALKRLVIYCCQKGKRPPFLLGLHNLAALQHLEISSCWELCFLPDERLPSRLKVLHVAGCPLLREWCREQRSKLAHISQITLDGSDYDRVQDAGCESGRKAQWKEKSFRSVEIGSRRLAASAHTFLGLTSSSPPSPTP